MKRKAQISTETLEDIYELTYKYQMLKQETERGDYGLPSQLPDRAYMEFEKIKGRLAELIDYALDETKSIFDSWVAHHAEDTDFASARLEYYKEEFLKEHDLELLERLFGKDIVRNVIVEYIENSDKKEEIIEELEFNGWEMNETKIEEISADDLHSACLCLEVAKYLEEDLYDEMESAFMDTPSYQEFVLDSNYEQYPALSGIELVSEQLAEYETLSFDDKITLFQEALTTAHNNGSMADYLIDIDIGKAVKFLDYLSSGPKVKNWDNELTKLLGHPPGSKAPKDEWFVPAHLRKAQQTLFEFMEDPNFVWVDAPEIAPPLNEILFHGTLKKNKESIENIGLIPGMGAFVEEAYSEYIEACEEEVAELVFAADYANISNAITAMIKHISLELDKHFHDVTDKDIYNHGMLLMFHWAKEDFEHRPEDDREEYEYPLFVEPGDYYSEYSVVPDEYLTGHDLLRFLSEIEELPSRDWKMMPLEDQWGAPGFSETFASKQAYNINKNKLHTLWWEDEDGNFITADMPDNPSEIPEEAKYQVSRFPTMVNTTYLRLNPDGTSTEIAKYESSYSEDLALALAVSNDFSLSEAIIIASEACARCMNALAYDYGLDWGYPEGSKEWKEANTECEFCKDMDDYEHMWAEDD